MRRVLLASLSFCLLLSSYASNIAPESLPSECHPSFVHALKKADLAVSANDPQFAQALLEGILYPNGVKVNIDLQSAGSSHASVENALRRAIFQWHSALDQKSLIQLVGSNQKADLTIRLVDKLPNRSDRTLGLIELKKSYSWNKSIHKVSYQGTISVKRSWDGKSLNEDELTEVICHELGHLLGLADVDVMGSLMGPMDRNHLLTGPQKHEVQALRLLRQAAQERLTQIEADILAKK